MDFLPSIFIVALGRCAAIFAVGLVFASRLAADDKDAGHFTAEQIEYFESHVRPILVERCYECHSTDAKELKAGLLVDSRQSILKGGESGPAVAVGDPKNSLLIEAVRYEAYEMPPDEKLRVHEITALERWVEMGAPWPHVSAIPAAETLKTEIDWEAVRKSHWAWQPVRRAPVPVTRQPTHNPIDNFAIARRTAEGVDSVAPAEAKVLVRRIYLDLIGIVPTPNQVQQFLESAMRERQAAVQRLVDTLLDSPLYGQRWARHWLDVARYSDGHGGFLDNNALDDAWRYRDWVVSAMNGDMPFDRFVTLQLAGDLLGDESASVATGFFALGPTYRSDGGDPDSVAQAKGETLDDRVDTFTRGMLGITGSCARCHDHKFDPIPQVDYYSLAGIFNNTEVQNQPLGDDASVERFNAHKKSVNELSGKINGLQKKKNRAKRELTEEESKQLQSWKLQLADLEKEAPSKVDFVHALTDTGSVDMHLAVRGNLLKQGSLVPRRMLRIVSSDSAAYTLGSGRVDLARAVVDPGNPLTARVFVNRVWQHHFGQGLVRTPSNFGALGEPPTHPELLDWLAAEFVETGWSIKSLHRLILTSDTYQLGSQNCEASYSADSDNRLFWRFSPRRMDIESWRDSLLSLTGDLDTSLNGPSSEDIGQSPRRTLYAKVSRNGDQFASDEFLRRFDFPIMRATVSKRPTSIVPQQYLFLLNSQFMINRAQRFALQISQHSVSIEARIEMAYSLLFSRRPSQEELRLGVEFIGGETGDGEKLSVLERYAQVLLSSNEFMFVR